MEREKAVKLITMMLMAVVLTMSLVITCPSFSITSKAAESDTATWAITFPYVKSVYFQQFSSSKTVEFDNTIIDYCYQTYNISENMEMGGSIIVTYNSFLYECYFNYHSGNSWTLLKDTNGLLNNIYPYLIDNLGNKYLLDENGGTINIADTTGLTSFSLYFQGSVTGNLFISELADRINIFSNIEELELTFSNVIPARTITDSEGTVWTIPDGIESPVIINMGTSKYLVDGSSSLGFYNHPNNESVKVLCSDTVNSAVLYDLDGNEIHTALLEEYTKAYGVQAESGNILYSTNTYMFLDFLYGTLPDIPVKPFEVSPDYPGQLLDLGTLKIGESNEDGFVKDGTVTVPGGLLEFKTKYADFRDNQGQPGLEYLRHALIEDFCKVYIGDFNLRVLVDGYVTLQFTNIWMYPQLYKPDNLTDSSIFPVGLPVPETALFSEFVESVIVLHANGQDYYVSTTGGNVRIPVNKGYNTVGLEICLRVKDDFIANHDGFIQAIYRAQIDDFDVYIREYKDSVTSAVEDIKETLENQLEESKKQTDALTKYEGADKMQSDNDKLSGAIKDYDDVSNSLFESAGDSISDFDLGSAFEYGSSLISAFGFLATVITSIIQQMGYFSMLYPLGVAMVIIGALLGLSKYMTSPGPGEMPKDDHPYRPDPTQLRLPDKRHSEHRKK